MIKTSDKESSEPLMELSPHILHESDQESDYDTDSECDDSDDEPKSSEESTLITKSGRIIKPFVRLDL